MIKPDRFLVSHIHNDFIIMKEIRPACDPNGVYSVKRTCAELGISNKTLRKYRENGYIKQLNPGNVSRPKYSGQSIIDCWNLLRTI
jgi:hypothetical protein